jgi:PqqD family protein of HPr-rel-A system
VAGPRSEGSPLRFVVTEGLRIRSLDDEAVVFDPLSWDVHLLNPAALAVLELLRESASSERDVTAFLAGALEAREQPDAPSHAQRVLSELRTLGLIRLVD